MLLYLPDAGRVFAINDETEKALRSDNPIGTLTETLALPIVQVSGVDPRTRRAVEQAREQWPDFVAAYKARAGKNFCVNRIGASRLIDSVRRISS